MFFWHQVGEAQELRCELIQDVLVVAARYQLAQVQFELLGVDQQLIMLDWCEGDEITGSFTPVVQLIALIQRVAVLHPVPDQPVPFQYLDEYQVVAAENICDIEPFIGGH